MDIITLFKTLILVALGLLVFLIVLFIIVNFIKSHRGVPVEDISLDFSTPEIQPKQEIPDLDEIHNHLRFGTYKMIDEVKKVELLDGSIEEVKSKEKKLITPKYEFVDRCLKLTFDPSCGPADINYLQSKAQVYSEFLYEKEIIDVPRLWPEVDPIHDYIVNFLFVEDAIADELEIKNVLKNTGTFMKQMDGSLSYPKVYRDNDDLMFDTSGCLIGEEVINRSTAQFSATFNKNYKYILKEGNNLWRMVDLKPRADRYFPFKTKVSGQREKLLELVEKGQALVKKNNMEMVLLGEIEDPVIQLPTQVFSTINDFVHGVVVGQTGSGKSTTLLSTIFINALINRALGDIPDIYYFADGKSGGDFDLPARYLSNYPVAQKSSGSDPMVELANIFNLVWTEYMRRQQLFKEAREAGKSVRNIFEYREEVGPLPRVWVIVDEFKAFLGDMDFDSLVGSNGSIPYMLVRLFAEARSFGFTFIFASQRFQQDSFPTVLRSNLPTRFTHNVQASDLGVLQMDSMPILEKGGYMLKLEGLTCPRTNTNQIQCRMPYLGSTEEFKGLLDEFFVRREHKTFDYDLIYNKGQAENLDKLDTKGLWLLVKKLFIQEQGFTIKKQYAQDHHIDSMDISSHLDHPEFPNGIGFGILDKNDSIDKFFGKRNKSQTDKMNADLYVFFVCYDLNKKDENEVASFKQDGDIPKNFCFISNSLFRKPLKRAYADYEEQKQNTFFIDLLKDLQFDFDANETKDKQAKEERPEVPLKMVGGKAEIKGPTVDELVQNLTKEAISIEDKIKQRLATWAEKKAKEKEILAMKASDPEYFEVDEIDESQIQKD